MAKNDSRIVALDAFEEQPSQCTIGENANESVKDSFVHIASLK